MPEIYDLAEMRAKQEQEKWAKLVLPDEFWDADYDLALIRDAARRRQVAPYAVLGACLARITALCDHRLRIPPIRGATAPLSVWSVISGNSAASKSAAMRIARALLPASPPGFRELTAATGEALLEACWEERENEKGKIESFQEYTNLLVAFDEGSLLTQLKSRQGNTLNQFLLTMWNGTAVGTETLSSVKKGKKRGLQEGDYVLSLLLAIQPEPAEELLADGGTGFVQRLVWFSAVDLNPIAARCDTSISPLHWTMPRITDLRDRATDSGGLAVHVPGSVQDEVREAGAAALLPDTDTDPFDGHRMLSRLRVAAALALLGSRIDIGERDWALAGTVMDVSDRIQRGLVDRAAARTTAKIEASIEQHAAGIVTAEEVREDRIIARGMETALRALKRRGSLTRGVLRNQLSAPQKGYFTEILHRLEADGLITVDEDGPVSLC